MYPERDSKWWSKRWPSLAALLFAPCGAPLPSQRATLDSRRGQFVYDENDAEDVDEKQAGSH